MRPLIRSKIIYSFFHSLAFYHMFLLLQSPLMTGWYMAYKILMGETWDWLWCKDDNEICY